MTDKYEVERGFYKHDQKDTEIDTQPSSSFHVRTGIKCGGKSSFESSDPYSECYAELDPICGKWCWDQSMTQHMLTIDCACYP